MISKTLFCSRKTIVLLAFIISVCIVKFVFNPSSTWLHSLILNQPKVNQKYHLQKVKNFIRRIDNIVDDQNEGFYISAEMNKNQGKILHIASSGETSILIDGRTTKPLNFLIL